MCMAIALSADIAARAERAVKEAGGGGSDSRASAGFRAGAVLQAERDLAATVSAWAQFALKIPNKLLWTHGLLLALRQTRGRSRT